MTSPKFPKIRYKVLKKGYLMQMHYNVGDEIELIEAQAQYYLPPYDNRLMPVTQAAPTPPAKRPAPAQAPKEEPIAEFG